MTLPKPPPPRRFRGIPPRAPTRSTSQRLRGMVREHEEEERPFEPERRGSWRGTGRELVVNPKLAVNPNQFNKDLEELIVKRWGRTLHDPELALKETKRILKEGGRPGDVMRELDELLDTHGVEYVQGLKNEVSYLNTGDTYEPTIMYSEDEDKYFISDWGTLVEEASSEAEEDAWGDSIEREVRSELESEFEKRLEGNEKLLDRVAEFVEELDSDKLKGMFWHALSDAGGEYVHESDGSVYVSGQDKAVRALADDILKDVKAVPEQESFGFNPRRRNGGAMTAEEFMAQLKAEADVRGRSLRMSFEPRTGQVFVDLWNLPELPAGQRYDGAEAHNNRFMFVVDGFSTGRVNFGSGAPIAATKVKLEHSVNSAGREYRLRGKTGSPDQVARYLAAHLTKIAAEVAPKYTHSRAPNSGAPNVERFSGKSIDARVTIGGVEYERTLAGKWETYGGGTNGSAVRDPQFRAELDALADSRSPNRHRR